MLSCLLKPLSLLPLQLQTEAQLWRLMVHLCGQVASPESLPWLCAAVDQDVIPALPLQVSLLLCMCVQFVLWDSLSCSSGSADTGEETHWGHMTHLWLQSWHAKQSRWYTFSLALITISKAGISLLHAAQFPVTPNNLRNTETKHCWSFWRCSRLV